MSAPAAPEAQPETVQTPVTRTLTAQFTVPGEPVSKERARTTKRGHTYTPQKTVDAETAVLAAYLASEPLGMIPKGVFCGLTATFHNGNRRLRDIDNMLKLVQDALNGYAYEDDSQIVELHGHKAFVTKSEARTEVTVHMLTIGGIA